MSKAVIYTRTNTPEGPPEGERTLSGEHQLQTCQRIAAERGLDVVEVFEDTALSTHDVRAEALTHARRDDVDHLLMFDVERWSRRLPDFLQLVPVLEKLIFAREEGMNTPAATFPIQTLLRLAAFEQSQLQAAQLEVQPEVQA